MVFMDRTRYRETIGQKGNPIGVEVEKLERLLPGQEKTKAASNL